MLPAFMNGRFIHGLLVPGFLISAQSPPLFRYCYLKVKLERHVNRIQFASFMPDRWQSKVGYFRQQTSGVHVFLGKEIRRTNSRRLNT